MGGKLSLKWNLYCLVCQTMKVFLVKYFVLMYHLVIILHSNMHNTHVCMCVCLYDETPCFVMQTVFFKKILIILNPCNTLWDTATRVG